jgi:hypothetical protein
MYGELARGRLFHRPSLREFRSAFFSCVLVPAVDCQL